MLKTSNKIRWVGLLYFAEGLPFGLVSEVMPVYFRMHGMSFADIGLMNLIQLPWSLKILWGPWIDRFGSPRLWIAASLGLLALWHAALGWLDMTMQPWQLGAGLTFCLAAVTITSATQDMAIDGYFLRLIGRGEEGMANGVRSSAYRVAMIVGGGGAVMAAGNVAWSTVFMALGALFAVLACLVVTGAPDLPRPTPQPWRDWWLAMVRWLAQPGALKVFAFIMLYRLGDASMAAMVKPFWVDRGATPAQIGLISTTVGIGATIVGALLGGWFVARHGILRALWVLGSLQALSNLGYAAVAYADGGHTSLYLASVGESVSQGLGTAAQLALLSRICDRQHAVTQYALLSALSGLTRALAGVMSGVGVQSLGFGHYFSLTFALSLPAFAFLPAVAERLKRA